MQIEKQAYAVDVCDNILNFYVSEKKFFSNGATASVNGELSVTYSPIHYIVRMNRKGSTEIQPLMLAMYNYYLAAEQFCSEL